MQIDRATDPKESMEGLNLMKMLHKSLTCAVLLVDEQQRISHLNAAAETLLGLEAGQNQTLEVLPPLLRESIQETLSNAQPLNRAILFHHPNRGEIAIQLS